MQESKPGQKPGHPGLDVAAAAGPEAVALLANAHMRCAGCGSKVHAYTPSSGHSFCHRPHLSPCNACTKVTSQAQILVQSLSNAK